MESLLHYDRCLSTAMSINTIKESKDSTTGVEMLRQFLLQLEYSGHGIPWIGITLFMIYFKIDIGDKQFYCNLFLGLIFDLLVVGFLKVVVRRKRPENNVDDMFATVSVDRYSFPSGHSTRAAMVALLFSLYWTNTMCIIFGYIWASMVSISRVVLGRHHVSDVTLGVVIGYFEYYFIVQVWLSPDTCTALTDFL